MEKKVFDYDEFLNESSPTAPGYDGSFFNTPGLGNVVPGTVGDIATYSDGDENAIKKMPGTNMHERGHNDYSWMKPSGDYTNRNWLVPNYELFMDERQSLARFQIGEAVRCVNPNMRDCYGKMGKIVAFEDQIIRWEEFGSETHVGLTARQYRCKPQDLDPLV
jgi:hypothetical protein